MLKNLLFYFFILFFIINNDMPKWWKVVKDFDLSPFAETGLFETLVVNSVEFTCFPFNVETVSISKVAR